MLARLRRSLVFVLPIATFSASAHAQDPNAPSSGSQPQPTSPSQAPANDARRGALMPSGPATSPAPAPGSAAAPTATPPAAAATIPSVSPSQDATSLAAQGAQRPIDGSIGGKPSDVFAEDWWSHTRPIVELHGYFRTRGELFHNFTLGRHDALGNNPYNLWPQPLDNSYVDLGGVSHTVQLCGDRTALAACQDKSEASANLRFRLNPELHISDNLRIVSQIDALDNLVLGSTPDAYAGGAATNGYAALGAFSTTQGPPTPGVNSLRNAIDVKRVWAEYMTPVGQLRFGRMPDHWGLGMVHNSGDGIDSDYQSTTDRIMFVSGVKSIDFYFGGAWDFVSTGPTNASPYDVYGGQPYNVANNANVGEWALFAARRMNPDLQRLALSRGDVVLNGGLYAVYRSQLIDYATQPNGQVGVSATNPNNYGFERRGAYAFIPDPWVQLLWRKLRFEAEFAAVWGSVENSPISPSTQDPVKLRQFGVTTQTEYKAVEDKLRLQFGFGWASGDPWAQSLSPGSGMQPELNGRGPISTFRFHPDYRVDLIFFRHILSRVEGAYYFRPSVEYDFLRNPNGQKFGGNAAIIWSRASEFMQTPGHKRDLGVELDLSLYYQAKDGSLNDDPEKLGGFFAMLQYGVFFPLGGLSYLQGETNNTNVPGGVDTSAAQTVRLFLGVAY